LNKDFTLSIYKQLLNSVSELGIKILNVSEFLRTDDQLCLGIRHDIDRKIDNAARMAELENELGISTTYYVRCKRSVLKPDLIRKIYDLNHEIGYHYEDLASANGNYEIGINNFKQNLERLREICSIKTIAAHGSPLSDIDSRDLWNRYKFREFGIKTDISLEINSGKFIYISDAGRSWNNRNINRRDKIDNKNEFEINHTLDIIDLIAKPEVREKLLINIHPEHWSDSFCEWYRIKTWRIVKNAVKTLYLKFYEKSEI